VPQADYGGTVALQIVEGSTTSTWDVVFASRSWNYRGYSTGNTMSPNLIYEGQELAGTEGASAPVATFTLSAYQLSDHVTWNYQTIPGNLNITLSSVDNGYWNPPPNGSNLGGTWEDYCCQGH
jgi:hypothetical protein